jgi:hypothetical protein
VLSGDGALAGAHAVQPGDPRGEDAKHMTAAGFLQAARPSSTPVVYLAQVLQSASGAAAGTSSAAGWQTPSATSARLQLPRLRRDFGTSGGIVGRGQHDKLVALQSTVRDAPVLQERLEQQQCALTSAA